MFSVNINNIKLIRKSEVLCLPRWAESKESFINVRHTDYSSLLFSFAVLSWKWVSVTLRECDIPRFEYLFAENGVHF